MVWDPTGERLAVQFTGTSLLLYSSSCVSPVVWPYCCSNRRFPRSMRSQGERPGCGSHVKRVDHGDAFNA